MTTRRDVLCGAAAAVPAALTGAGLAVADPEARLVAAVQELQDAMQAVWPGAQMWHSRWGLTENGNPGVVVIAQVPPKGGA